jgi:hypothetical protein
VTKLLHAVESVGAAAVPQLDRGAPDFEVLTLAASQRMRLQVRRKCCSLVLSVDDPRRLRIASLVLRAHDSKPCAAHGVVKNLDVVISQGDDERTAHRTAAVLLSDGEVPLGIDQSGQNVTIQSRKGLICRHIRMMATAPDESSMGT